MRPSMKKHTATSVKRKKCPDCELHRQEARNRRAVDKAILYNRRYCMSCGTKMAQESSKRVGLCQACRRHCICCGRETGVFGRYDVCVRCARVVDLDADYIRKHDGRLPGDDTAATDGTTPMRENCKACGDPAEGMFEGRPYCAECLAEMSDSESEDEEGEQ